MEMARAALVVGALQGWAGGQGPVYRQLASALEAAIDAGRLPPGTILPPERALAEALAVSRSTVVAALDGLKRSGHLEARQGSGTWVRRRPRLPDEGNRQLLEELEGHAIVRDLSGAPAQTIELTVAAVDCAPEVVDAAASFDVLELAGWHRGHGYAPQGLEELRTAIAQRLTALGLPTGPHEVLVTTGATQALLLAARLYLEPGAPAVVETPTYAGAIDVLHAAGARLLTVETDPSGARTDQLADAMRRALPRLVYLVPDFQNPTGVVLSEPRRREIARLAGELHVPVVEDLVQRELWFDRPPPPPIASFAPDAPVLTVGSLSKVFWGGLRLGWVRANETTVNRLARMKAVTDFGTPVVAQALGSALLPRTDAVAHRRRQELQNGLAVLERTLAEELPGWRWFRPEGGLCLWASLPSPRAEELARRAQERGLTIVPGTAFAVGDRRHADKVRLPFVAPPDVLEEGVRRLAAAWADLGERAEPARHALVV